jgi:hypothetical protein
MFYTTFQTLCSRNIDDGVRIIETKNWWKRKKIRTKHGAEIRWMTFSFDAMERRGYFGVEITF